MSFSVFTEMVVASALGGAAASAAITATAIAAVAITQLGFRFSTTPTVGLTPNRPHRENCLYCDAAMSEENVEVVRRVYEGWARGDFSNVDDFDPDIEFAMADWPHQTE